MYQQGAHEQQGQMLAGMKNENVIPLCVILGKYHWLIKENEVKLYQVKTITNTSASLV